MLIRKLLTVSMTLGLLGAASSTSAQSAPEAAAQAQPQRQAPAAEEGQRRRGPGGRGRMDSSLVFPRMDADGSGGVSRAEYTAFMETRRAERGGEPVPAEMMTRRFDRIDANADGQLTLAEFQARPAARPQGAPATP